MRRLVVLILVAVLGLLVVADRAALLVAENQISSRVEKSQGLASHPDVSIKGFPFLTQVVRGRYKQVDVTIHNVTRNELTVDRVSVYAHGVSIPLGSVLTGSVKEVPVERAQAEVVLGYANLNSYLANRLGGALTVSRTGNQLTLTGTLPFPPHVSLAVTSRIDVSGDAITLSPAGLDAALARIPGGTAVQGLKGLVQQFFTVRLPISQLPFGIRLKSAEVTPEGVVIAASATGLTLRAPSS
jgi:hypothetical protein